MPKAFTDSSRRFFCYAGALAHALRESTFGTLESDALSNPQGDVLEVGMTEKGQQLTFVTADGTSCVVRSVPLRVAALYSRTPRAL
jgi:hypothetical protein